MKNTKVYYLFFFMIILTISLFIINMMKERSVKKEKEYIEKEEKNVIEYKANETIRVKLNETGEIVAMDVNDYLRGVLPAEMSPKYNIEALKAQAIVARTYLYKKMENYGEGDDADICDYYGHCQAFYSKDKIFEIWKNKGYTQDEILEFWDKINQAVVLTQGEVILYNGELINAYFHASSPNGTENVNQIWGGVSYPYLLPVESIEDELYENRTSQVIISYSDFINILNNDDSINASIKENEIEDICINEYTTTGRVKSIRVNEYIISAEKLRTLIGLKSTLFDIELPNEDKLNRNIIFNVVGYGHGIGMSQVGANTYAENGMKYNDIIKHYYTGVDIIKFE